MKKVASVLLSIIMLISIVPFAYAQESKPYETGDIVQFGSYPQSKVTDEALIEELNGIISGKNYYRSYYEHYSGDGEYGSMSCSYLSNYVDITYDGNMYRGVEFNEHRPTFTHDYRPTESVSYNGYETNVVYWFKYEPIDWIVLDPDTGLVVCATAIDAQPYSNTVYKYYDKANKTYSYFNDEGNTNYASDYETSSIREWLNNDFYYTAFSVDENMKINFTALNNDGYYTSKGITGHEELDSAETKDQIFLLSYDEVLDYDLVVDTPGYLDASKMVKGSDYADIQGLANSDLSVGKFAYWLLRTPGDTSLSCCYINSQGVCPNSGYDVNWVGYGIRPAMRLISLTNPKEYDIIKFGSYPQSEVKDEETLSALNSIAPEWEEWTSYGYYSGNYEPGSMVQGDWMRYTDVSYNGYRYRGVKFTQYRPGLTYFKVGDYYDRQEINGYYTDTTYWFKFESVKWRVLDPVSGLILCELLIDAQPYTNTLYENELVSDYNYAIFNDADFNNYANDYETSSIRKWLNEDFYNTAFTDKEKNRINKSALGNNGYYTSIGVSGYEMFDGKVIYDKIFLLSYNEATSSKYGFAPGDEYDINKFANGTDYAKSQNLLVNYKEGYHANISPWWTRTAGEQSNGVSCIVHTGEITNGNMPALTMGGVRPAMRISDISQIEDHDHYYSSEVTTESTHLANGEITYSCICEHSYTETIAKLTDHTYTSAVTKEPSHLEEGIETFTCACGDSYTETIAKSTEHTYTSVVTKEPTHLKEGVETFSCECGDSYTKDIDKLAEHTYKKTVTKPTCTTQGYTTYTCECGDSYKNDYVGVTEHKYNSTVTRPATHLSKGLRVYTCTACGDSYNEDIPKTTNHSYYISKIVTADCENEGYTLYTCECGDSYKADKTPATGHNYKGNKCTYCGESKVSNCSCNCHKTGFMGIIWKLLRFFYKLFKSNKICACGVAHY